MGAAAMKGDDKSGPESLVVSKERVSAYGEVLTGQREVKAMLDLVKNETERIESRFLEPACGDGNFLAEVLERKLAKVEKRYKKSQSEFEKYSVLAVSSIYGVEIQEDNVQKCRYRLFGVFDYRYSRLYKRTQNRVRETVRYILDRNIVWGDALELKTCGPKKLPIVFSQWAPVGGSLIKRTDFAYHDLSVPDAGENEGLFAAQRGVTTTDTGEKGFIPESIHEYPPMPYWELPHV